MNPLSKHLLSINYTQGYTGLVGGSSLSKKMKMTLLCQGQGTLCPTVADQTYTSLEGSTTGQAQIAHMDIWNGDVSKFAPLTFLLSYFYSALFQEHSAFLDADTSCWTVLSQCLLCLTINFKVLKRHLESA